MSDEALIVILRREADSESIRCTGIDSFAVSASFESIKGSDDTIELVIGDNGSELFFDGQDALALMFADYDDNQHPNDKEGWTVVTDEIHVYEPVEA